jgi:hypothetical protein
MSFQQTTGSAAKRRRNPSEPQFKKNLMLKAVEPCGFDSYRIDYCARFAPSWLDSKTIRFKSINACSSAVSPLSLHQMAELADVTGFASR